MTITGNSRPTASRQFIANVIGRVWVLLANFLFAPVYLHLMGLGNFGVVGLYIAVSGLVAFLDLGLSPTIARELNLQGRTEVARANLLYTYEAVYLVIIGVMIVTAMLLPEGVFGLFLAADDLARPEVAGSIRLLFSAAAAQMLLNFYVAGLLGVEQQVAGNLVLVASGFVRSGLVILPLYFWPTPVVFMAWQLATALVCAVFARALLYQVIGSTGSAKRRAFDWGSVAGNSAFTGGMVLASVTAAVNTQIDKIFVGKLAGLESLGQYSLVSTFAQLLVFAVSPITIMLLPRLVRGASAGNSELVRRLFLVSHRLVAGIVCAGLASMLFFGPYLMSIWTAGKLDAESVGTFAPMLVAGYALLAISTVPHCVAVAYKNLTGSLVLSTSVFVTVPGYWFLAKEYGAAGAATMWLLLQSIVVPLYLAWVVRRLIGIPSVGRFMASTVLVPLVAALAICALGYHLLGGSGELLRNLLVIAVAIVASVGVCLRLSLAPADRAFLLGGMDR